MFDVLSLPASYTKGADAMNRSNVYYERKTLSFKKLDFDKAISQIVRLTKAGEEVNPEDFYPPPRKNKEKSRDLPLVDIDLRDALDAHIIERLTKDPRAKKTDPLFLSQKGSPYSANTLQGHMAVPKGHIQCGT